MNDDDEPLVAEVRDPSFTAGVRERTYSPRELGATKLFHTKCPCCGYVAVVDATMAEKSMQKRTPNRGWATKVRLRTAAQRYFAECWKWTTNLRMQNIKRPDGGMSKTVTRGVKSASVDMAYQCGTGRSLRRCYLKSRDKGLKNWFAVLWHDAPRMGEMFFACLLGDLFAVLQGIADDSPEFAYRLRLAADNALKRSGSTRLDLLNDPAPEAAQGGRQTGFDAAAAVEL